MWTNYKYRKTIQNNLPETIDYLSISNYYVLYFYMIWFMWHDFEIKIVFSDKLPVS